MPRTTGRYERIQVAGEEVAAFVPLPLPPAGPALRIEGSLKTLLENAGQALASLEAAVGMVPSVDWFLYAFVRKEAVVSSQIEGTQATLLDLFSFEAGGPAWGGAESGVREVCNYLDALSYARAQLRKPKGLPLSLRLLNECHRRLLKGARGEEKRPGEVRRSQNWIGGTRPGNAIYVPPPTHLLGRLLGDLEKYMHREKDALPPLVRAALLHAQFETIHPYLDGNGRIGRLLVTLLLEEWKLLSQPLLYLSLFFKRHRAEYYRLLNAVRTEGDWESWTSFFLEGTADIAGEAAAAARKLFGMVNADRVRVLAARPASVAALRLFEILPEHPVLTIAAATKLLRTTKPTAAKAVGALVQVRVLQETTGRQRDRTFGYGAYLDLLKAGTELEGLGRKRK